MTLKSRTPFIDSVHIFSTGSHRCDGQSHLIIDTDIVSVAFNGSTRGVASVCVFLLKTRQLLLFVQPVEPLAPWRVDVALPSNILDFVQPADLSTGTFSALSLAASNSNRQSSLQQNYVAVKLLYVDTLLLVGLLHASGVFVVLNLTKYASSGSASVVDVLASGLPNSTGHLSENIFGESTSLFTLSKRDLAQMKDKVSNSSGDVGITATRPKRSSVPCQCISIEEMMKCMCGVTFLGSEKGSFTPIILRRDPPKRMFTSSLGAEDKLSWSISVFICFNCENFDSIKVLELRIDMPFADETANMPKNESSEWEGKGSISLSNKRKLGRRDKSDTCIGTSLVIKEYSFTNIILADDDGAVLRLSVDGQAQQMLFIFPLNCRSFPVDRQLHTPFPLRDLYFEKLHIQMKTQFPLADESEVCRGETPQVFGMKKSAAFMKDVRFISTLNTRVPFFPKVHSSSKNWLSESVRIFVPLVEMYASDNSSLDLRLGTSNDSNVDEIKDLNRTACFLKSTGMGAPCLLFYDVDEVIQNCELLQEDHLVQCELHEKQLQLRPLCSVSFAQLLTCSRRDWFNISDVEILDDRRLLLLIRSNGECDHRRIILLNYVGAQSYMASAILHSKTGTRLDRVDFVSNHFPTFVETGHLEDGTFDQITDYCRDVTFLQVESDTYQVRLRNGCDWINSCGKKWTYFGKVTAPILASTRDFELLINLAPKEGSGTSKNCVEIFRSAILRASIHMLLCQSLRMCSIPTTTSSVFSPSIGNVGGKSKLMSSTFPRVPKQRIVTLLRSPELVSNFSVKACNRLLEQYIFIVRRLNDLSHYRTSLLAGKNELLECQEIAKSPIKFISNKIKIIEGNKIKLIHIQGWILANKMADHLSSKHINSRNKKQIIAEGAKILKQIRAVLCLIYWNRVKSYEKHELYSIQKEFQRQLGQLFYQKPKCHEVSVIMFIVEVIIAIENEYCNKFSCCKPNMYTSICDYVKFYFMMGIYKSKHIAMRKRKELYLIAMIDQTLSILSNLITSIGSCPEIEKYMNNVISIIFRQLLNEWTSEQLNFSTLEDYFSTFVEGTRFSKVHTKISAFFFHTLQKELVSRN